MAKKIFTFGDGAVAITGSWIYRHVILTQIEPPVGVGTAVSDETLEKDGLYSVTIKGSLLKELKEKVSELTGPIILEFEDFILDFTNYNTESVRILKDKVDEAFRGCSQLALAC